MSEKKKTRQEEVNIFLNKYFALLSFIVAILVFILLYSFIISPKLTQTKMVIKSNIGAQEKLFEEQKLRLKELQTIYNVYSKIPVSDLDTFNQVLPNNYVKESLFGELEEITSRSGYILESLDINDQGPTSISATIGAIEGVANISGLDYRNLKKFIQDLEKSSRLIDVQGISYSVEGESLELTFLTYYYKAS